jgi:hypothetical protein
MGQSRPPLPVSHKLYVSLYPDHDGGQRGSDGIWCIYPGWWPLYVPSDWDVPIVVIYAGWPS